MPRSSLRIYSNKSQALIIVIAFLAMFFVIGIAFFMLAQQEQFAAVKHLDAVRSRYIAEAGIVYAQEVLQTEKKLNAIDSLDDVSFSHFAGERWFEVRDASGNRFGRFSISVSDEAGKLHLNVCSEQELANLLSECSLDPSRAASIIAGRPYRAVEELSRVLGTNETASLIPYVTVYSRDREFDLKNNRRPYLNSANAQLILDVFLDRGIEDARQKAALVVDAGDEDLSQTQFVESLLSKVTPSGMIDQGGWQFTGDVYRAVAGSLAGVFHWSNLAIADGEYDCFVYASSSNDTIGSIQGQVYKHAEKLAQKVSVSGGGFTMTIAPASDGESVFSHLRLVEAGAAQGMSRSVAAGSEAIAINEIMPAPWQDFTATLALGKGERGEFTFNAAHLPQGKYHVMVLSGSPGGYVGDVTCAGVSGKDLSAGDFLSSAVSLGETGIIQVSVVNNDPVKQALFGGIRLSRQPDAEFIELINLSSQPVDIGGCSLEVMTPEGELVKGYPAVVGENTVVQPFQHLVLATDNDDGSEAPGKLRGNGVSFRNAWGFGARHPDFGAYEPVIDRTFDLFPDAGGIVVLKNKNGRTIDAAEYAATMVMPFISIERSDPASRVDADKDGLVDGWYFSSAKSLATPGATNENLGMYTQQGGLTKHSPAQIKLFNRPLQDLSELVQISNGVEWERFDARDCALVCDSFAYGVQELWFSGQEGSAVEMDAGASHEWKFDAVPAAAYWVSIEGEDVSDISVLVSVAQTESPGANLSLAFRENRLHYGMAQISGADKGSLYVRIENTSGKKIALEKIILEPVLSVAGRINVNTATTQVLKSVFNDGSLVQAVLENRPLGNRNGDLLGVGDLILLNPAFLGMHSRLTVRSDVYELKSRGEYLVRDKTSATESIRIIYDRGGLVKE
jgi:type II secretory pathway component PulK